MTPFPRFGRYIHPFKELLRRLAARPQGDAVVIDPGLGARRSNAPAWSATKSSADLRAHAGKDVDLAAALAIERDRSTI